MNKNIVIFGCDNSGKTTLCSLLEDEFGGNVEVIPSLGPNHSAYDQNDFMERNILKLGVKIFDRFPLIEEAVCGNVLRKHDNFADLPWRISYALLNHVDLFIYCFPGLEVVENWGDREQMEGVKENIKKLVFNYDLFKNFLIERNYYVLEYNYKNYKDYNSIVNAVTDLVKGV